MERQTSTLKTTALLLFCAGGIYASYLTQGVVQETLSTKRFGPQQERFTELKALNGVQSLVCFIWAALLAVLLERNQKGKECAPFLLYWKPAITNSIGPACGIQALKNISYPAQVLVKSSKMIPVMLVGTAVYGKRYSILEYLCAVLIAGGVSLFARKSSSKVLNKLASPNAPLGYFLCLLNLVLDGYTNAAQDELHRKYKDTSPLQMMCWMNFWCTIYNGAYMFVATQSGWEILAFCGRHPDAAWDILLFCLCGAVGQLFIFMTIRRFGSVVNTIITTTRKFFNILLSVVWNANPLLPQQWVAVVLVFIGLALSMAVKALQHRKRAKTTKLP